MQNINTNDYDDALENALKVFSNSETTGIEYNFEIREFCIDTSLGNKKALNNVEAIVKKIGIKHTICSITDLWTGLEEIYKDAGPVVLIINFDKNHNFNNLNQELRSFFTKLRNDDNTVGGFRRNAELSSLINRRELYKSAGQSDRANDVQGQIVKYQSDMKLAPSKFFEVYKSQWIQAPDEQRNKQMTFIEFINEIDTLVKFDSNDIWPKITVSPIPLYASYFYASLSNRIFVIAINYIDKAIGAPDENKDDWILDMFCNPHYKCD